MAAAAPGGPAGSVGSEETDVPVGTGDTAVTQVPVVSESERVGLLNELIHTLQLRRCPQSPSEVRIARIAVSTSGAVRKRTWKRLAATFAKKNKSKKDFFPTTPVATGEIDFAAVGSAVEQMNAIIGASPTTKPPSAPAPGGDPEGIATAPLPLTRARTEHLMSMQAGGVVTLSLPVRVEVLRGAPPRRWGRALDPAALPPEDRQALRDLLEKELTCGAIERVTSLSEVELITPVYVVRSGGKLRLIHDCRPLNNDLEHLEVKYSSVTDVAALLGKYATKIDLANAFKNVGLTEDDRRLLCFQLGKTVWRWKTLNFGCAASPALFDRAIRPAVDEMRRQKIRFLIYVDDILVVGDTVAELDAAVVATIDILESFGWGVSKAKVLCAAHTHIVFLGLRVSIVDGKLRIPVSKAEKLGRLCREAAGRERVALPVLQALCGLLNFLAIAVPVIGAMSRGLYGCLSEAQRLPGRHVWRRGRLDTELHWWADHASSLTRWEGRVQVGPDGKVVTLVTDASADGVGGLAWKGSECPDLNEWVSATSQLMTTTAPPPAKPGEANVDPETIFRGAVSDSSAPEGPKKARWPWLLAGGLSAADRLESSAVRELLALQQALRNLECDGWLESPTVVVWYSDSTAATRALVNWRSGSTRLASILTELWSTVLRLQVEVQPQWISRESGWLPGADWLSRIVGRRAQAEWSVPLERVNSVIEELRSPTPVLDAFASAANRRTTRFRSRWPEPGSEGPAFGDPWRDVTWAFPPFRMVTAAVQFWLAGPRLPLVLVVPADDRAALGISLAARSGAVRRTTAVWREPLIDFDGSVASGLGPPLRAVLLQEGRDDEQPSRRTGTGSHARSEPQASPFAGRAYPGPLK